MQRFSGVAIYIAKIMPFIRKKIEIIHFYRGCHSPLALVSAAIWQLAHGPQQNAVTTSVATFPWKKKTSLNEFEQVYTN